MQEYAEGQYSASATTLKVSLRRNPDNGTGWAVLGLSEFEVKGLREAHSSTWSAAGSSA